ncbi:unnamed protein product [Angiostrongylus costaricensis]|uniref:Transposase n=1 Tax=Angiostrongylus costaricensis TaxID=334426 RepID=A0A0R3PM15_ANGCS|nr:unnamed protein product [Angiostrongylus costaricensis]
MGLDLARHRLLAEHGEAGGRAYGEAQESRTATARPAAAGGHAATAARATIWPHPRRFDRVRCFFVDIQGDKRRERTLRRVG